MQGSTLRGARTGEHSVEQAQKEYTQAEEPVEFTECCTFVEIFEPTMCAPSKISAGNSYSANAGAQPTTYQETDRAECGQRTTRASTANTGSLGGSTQGLGQPR